MEEVLGEVCFGSKSPTFEKPTGGPRSGHPGVKAFPREHRKEKDWPGQSQGSRDRSEYMEYQDPESSAKMGGDDQHPRENIDQGDRETHLNFS